MTQFESLLSAARQLPVSERLRLIDALWETLPPDADIPFHEEWASELERRVAAFEAGMASTVPWTTIRDEALARIGHGNVR